MYSKLFLTVVNIFTNLKMWFRNYLKYLKSRIHINTILSDIHTTYLPYLYSPTFVILHPSAIILIYCVFIHSITEIIYDIFMMEKLDETK